MPDQSRQRCPQVWPANNQIDEAVPLQKFSGLEPWRQILMGRFPDYAWPGESDHAFRLR
jgi:hypothetical protein